MKATNRHFRGIFVTADDPKFLEQRVETKVDLLDLEQLNVAQIRDEYIRRQQNYDTAPFDPEGRALRFFPGGYTIWSGQPGAGKTTLLRQFACHLMHHDRKVMVASLEEDPVDVFYRHAMVALGTEDPAQAGLEWCTFHWAERLRLWNSTDLPAPHQRLFAAIRVMAAQGVRHAIIDSLMCLDVQEGDLEGQRMFVLALLRTLKASNVHIHLVAHPNKILRAGQEPDMNDVAGSSALIRLADNIVFTRRAGGESLIHAPNVTPMRITCVKQRHGSGGNGNLDGWFHRQQKQFKTDQFEQAVTQYLPAQAYRDDFQLRST
jgi:KaiC/GvpD/RAD55 family RecA-like ATPase